MTHEKKSRKKHWTAVLHDRGGYALFDHEGRLVVRCLNRKDGIGHHVRALQTLQRASTMPAPLQYPIVFQEAEELSAAATTPFVKPKIAKREAQRRQADD